MRRIVAAAFLSLDGVMQAPGGPTEDPTGGFDHGGWLAPVGDEEIGEEIGRIFASPCDLLLGRRTYDIFAAYWPYAPDETRDIRDPFSACTKFVMTRGDRDLPWGPTVRVGGIDALAELKRGDGPDLVIQGSSTLYPALLAAGLIDELTLMIAPVLLGSGKKLFGPGSPALTMNPVRHRTTARGSLIATFEPGGAVASGSFGDPSTSERERARQEAMAKGIW